VLLPYRGFTPLFITHSINFIIVVNVRGKLIIAAPILLLPDGDAEAMLNQAR
jgi:hypothetical protein